jgi:hypothetical protein
MVFDVVGTLPADENLFEREEMAQLYMTAQFLDDQMDAELPQDEPLAERFRCPPAKRR